MCPESRAAAGEEGQGNFAKIAASVCGHTRISEMRRTSRRNKKDTIRRRHRLPRMAGELSSAIAGTSPTASFSKPKPIGVAREAFIFAF